MRMYTQATTEKIDYAVTVTGDTISSATASVAEKTPASAADPTLGAVVLTSTTATVRVSGVVSGAKYTIRLHVVGASGQEWDRDAVVQG